MPFEKKSVLEKVQGIPFLMNTCRHINTNKSCEAGWIILSCHRHKKRNLRTPKVIRITQKLSKIARSFQRNASKSFISMLYLLYIHISKITSGEYVLLNECLSYSLYKPRFLVKEINKNRWYGIKLIFIWNSNSRKFYMKITRKR